MADVGAIRTSPEVSELKRKLESYRQVLIPLNKVLEWEQNFYPAVLVGIITFVFAVIWYLEPSVLTTICLLGLFVSIGDFLLPTISGFVFGSKEWTAVEEHQFEAICERMQHARQHRANICNYMLKLKSDKPNMYLVVLVVTFAVFAWLGCLIDNLLLTYLLVVTVSMLPGLRKHGILQKLTAKVTELVGSVKKPKTN